MNGSLPQQTEPTVADRIRAAKAMIDKPQKWCRGDMERHGRHCAFGACNEADGGGWADVPWWDTYMIPACLELVGFSSLIDFNDDPSSTHVDLMRIFDRAIEMAESA